MGGGGGCGCHPGQGELPRSCDHSEQARYRRQIEPGIKFLQLPKPQQRGVMKISCTTSFAYIL